MEAQLALGAPDPSVGPLGGSEALLAFTVEGVAKPGGSKRAFINPRTERIVIVEDSKNKPWRGLVSVEAGLAMERFEIPDPLTGPVAVEFTFYRPRPKWHFGTGRNESVLKASAPAFPTTRPDVLKLARAVEDAMTGIVYRDDSQIIDELLRKRWGSPERCEITIRSA